MRFIFLSDLLGLLGSLLGPSMLLQIAFFPSILWLSDIHLYINITSFLCIDLLMDVIFDSMSWFL